MTLMQSLIISILGIDFEIAKVRFKPLLIIPQLYKNIGIYYI